MNTHLKFMETAVELAKKNVQQGGEPFGAIVVKDGKIIGSGINARPDSCDPTAHAEILAIREACKVLKRTTLEDCILYTSCEPCPMCLGAIYWAQVKAVYYGCSLAESALYAFDSAPLYEQFALSPDQRRIPMMQIGEPQQRQEPFQMYRNS